MAIKRTTRDSGSRYTGPYSRRRPHLQNSRHLLPSGGFLFLKNIPELWLPVPLVMSMKTHHWLNPNRLLSHLRFATPLLLACFAAVFVSAPTPASARDQVPFKAT